MTSEERLERDRALFDRVFALAACKGAPVRAGESRRAAEAAVLAEVEARFGIRWILDRGES